MLKMLLDLLEVFEREMDWYQMMRSYEIHSTMQGIICKISLHGSVRVQSQRLVLLLHSGEVTLF